MGNAMVRGVLHIPAGQGDSLYLVGDTYTFKAVSNDTNGAFTLFEGLVPPGGGPPPHIHHREDEAFYLLEGELEFQEGERLFTARAGAFIYIPRGTIHRFKNVGTESAKMLLMFVPGGMDGLFFEVGIPATAGSSAPPPSQADVDKLLGAGPKYGLEVLPPSTQ